MKRFLTLALAGMLALGAGSVAYANICAFDPAPAATLLFPFVAYNYTQADTGVNTLFAITNVSSDATVVHVTLWSDYSTPVLDWNVLLTGYDVYTFNIRDILKSGKIPATFLIEHNKDSDGYYEGIIDQGPVSTASPIVDPEWEGDPDYPNGMAEPEATKPALNARCPTTNPAYPGAFATVTIPQNVLDYFKLLLQGSQTANTGGFYDCTDPTKKYNLDPKTWWEIRKTADDTWAYLTADVVDECNKTFPDETGYFDNTLNDNVLIGDVAQVNDNNNFSEVMNAVHLEADLDIATVATVSPNGPGWGTTFYARYSNADTLSDYREPLPTAWAFRYQNTTLGDGSALKTYIQAFKANTVRTEGPSATGDFYTHVADLWVDLNTDGSAKALLARNCLAYTYYSWDEEENVDIVPVEDPPWSGGPFAPVGVVPNLLPLETQQVNADQFNLVDKFGWLLFVWPYSNFGDDPQLTPRLQYQTHMAVKFAKTETVGSGFSGATDGAVMANYNCFAQQTLPGLGINFGYVYGGGYVRSSGASE